MTGYVDHFGLFPLYRVDSVTHQEEKRTETANERTSRLAAANSNVARRETMATTRAKRSKPQKLAKAHARYNRRRRVVCKVETRRRRVLPCTPPAAACIFACPFTCLRVASRAWVRVLRFFLREVRLPHLGAGGLGLSALCYNTASVFSAYYLLSPWCSTALVSALCVWAMWVPI